MCEEECDSVGYRGYLPHWPCTMKVAGHAPARTGSEETRTAHDSPARG
ncbi:hypothetical protein HD599_003248 [Conyzicola lurida]|uniref:Uncharacterized protein n=1 Tax=Conyzicola lurida TaxID=1172621 RepID=A0A841ATK8_9MICO|nr:hypothetical protein [Conyzicola lurida]